MMRIYEIGDLLETFDGRTRYRVRGILDCWYLCDVAERVETFGRMTQDRIKEILDNECHCDADEMMYFYRLKCRACMGEKFLLKTTKRIGHEAMNKTSETMGRLAGESCGIDILIREDRGHESENEAEIRRLREENGRLLQKLSIAEKYVSLARKYTEAAEKHLQLSYKSMEEED